MQLLDETDYPVPYTNTNYSALMTDDGLADIASYAQIIGPWKESLGPPIDDVTDGSGMLVVLHSLFK